MKNKKVWFVPAEIAHSTLFMISLPSRAFLQKWPQWGLGSYITRYFSYFKGDFCQMWYLREEFDKEADFLARKMITSPSWALKKIEQIEEYSKKFLKEAKKFRKLPFDKMKEKEMISAYQRVIKWQEKSHGMGAAISWHADADKERITKAIRNMLLEQIKKRKLNLPLIDTFTILSTPLAESFALKEEKEFLKIALKLNKSKTVKKIFKKRKIKNIVFNLKKIKPDLFSLIYAHYQKWRWLNYGYKGPPYQLDYFIERWKTLLLSKDSPLVLYNDLFRKKRTKKKAVEFN